MRILNEKKQEIGGAIWKVPWKIFFKQLLRRNTLFFFRFVVMKVHEMMQEHVGRRLQKDCKIKRFWESRSLLG